MQKKGTKREMGNIAYWNYTIMLFLPPSLPLSLFCVQIYTKRTGIWERTKGSSRKGTPAVPGKTQRRGTECDYFGTKLIQILSRKCRTKKWTSVSFPTILPSFPALCYLICDLRSFSSFDLSCTIYVHIAYNIHIHVRTYTTLRFTFPILLPHYRTAQSQLKTEVSQKEQAERDLLHTRNQLNETDLKKASLEQSLKDSSHEIADLKEKLQWATCIS